MTQSRVQMRMPTVAIMHYTGPPAIGGIEGLIGQMIAALHASGHGVVLIVGEGEPVPGAKLRRVPGLAPGSRDQDDEELGASLAEALSDCDACWIINLLTVTLHPQLSRALFTLIPMLSLRWVHWCADISASSSFARNEAAVELVERLRASKRVRHVAISEARCRELADQLDLPAESVSVINPPLDLAQVLGLSPESMARLRGLGLLDGGPLVLVPSKLLPHKRLDFAVEVADHLRRFLPHARMVITGSYSPHEPSLSDEVRLGMSSRGEAGTLHGLTCILSDWWGSRVPGDIVHALYLLADVMFLPSQEEGFGMPLLEAAIYRLPSVCMDIPALREAGNAATIYVSRSAPARDVARVLAEALESERPHGHSAAVASSGRFEELVRRLADDTLT